MARELYGRPDSARMPSTGVRSRPLVNTAGNGLPRPQPFVFQFEPDAQQFRLRLQFQKSQVSRIELNTALRAVLSEVEAAVQEEDSATTAA